MESLPRPTMRIAFARSVRLRCPACGKGRLFRRYFVRAKECGHCDWRFERGCGHWVGGSEIHMLASFGLSVILFGPVVALGGFSQGAIFAAIVGHVVLSLALFRYSRAVFLGMDHYFDPVPEKADERDGGPECVEFLPRPRTPGGAHRPVAGRSSRRAREKEAVSC